MLPIKTKLERLSRVATMYYELDMTQSDIAKEMKISRPMISKLLKEAKELGIVTITIQQQFDAQQMLGNQLAERFGLQEALVVSSEKSAARTNEKISKQVLSLCERLKGEKQGIGLGWGSMVGEMISCMEHTDAIPALSGDVFPLVGGIKASFRSYHPNELVRLFADKTGMNAAYLYMPAIFDSEEEKNVYEHTEAFRDIEDLWSTLTTAVVNISNYPSSPDIATAIRFGSKLTQARAVGNFLAYYYDREGQVIEPDHDIVMQISLAQLKRANKVLALCNSLVTPESLIGALHTGLFSHLVLSDELAMQVLQL